MNKIYFTQAWDRDRKIGKYYNEFMSMIPDGAWGCLMDGDTMFLDKNYGTHLYRYIELFPEATLTCRTNRMHVSNTNQQLEGIQRDNHDIMYHWDIAQRRKEKLYQVTSANNPASKELIGGMLMLVSKKVWKEVGGFDENGILDVDNHFHRALIRNKKDTLVMEGVYIYHRYRHDGSKQHLL